MVATMRECARVRPAERHRRAVLQTLWRAAGGGMKARLPLLIACLLAVAVAAAGSGHAGPAQ